MTEVENDSLADSGLPAEEGQLAVGAEGRRRAGPLARLSGRPGAGAVVGTFVLLGALSLLAPNFLTVQSIAATLTIAAELGVVAAGVTMLMIGGEFDLSVGSVLGLSSVIAPLLMTQGVATPLALLASLATAALIGLLNGVIVTRGRLPSFIVTLGGLFLWRGVLFAITEGFPIEVARGDPWIQVFSARLGSGIHASLFWFIALVGILSVVMARTRFGNWVYATGGNARAARQRGVPVDKVKVTLFILTATLAGLAGIMQMGRFSSVDSLRGSTLELEAVAAAVIGGTLLTGGYGSVIATALGCIMLAAIRNGLVLMGVQAYWYRAFIGILIVAVVMINSRVGRRQVAQ